MYARERFKTNAHNLVSSLISSLIIGSLIACTGSFEGGASSARLVFANPTAGRIDCLNDAGISLPVAVGVGLLITNTNLEQGNQLSNCTSVTTESAPYDLATTPTGDRIIISLPGNGRLEVRSNKINNPVIAKLLPKTGEFCPTRLALSPNAQRIAVLDDPDAPKDPNNPNAPERICTNTSNRSPRVLVFDLSAISASTTTLEPIRTATSGLSGTFQTDRANGPLALTINDIQAFVIAPITSYAIFKLNKDDNLRVNPQELKLAGLQVLDKTLRLDLTTIGTRLLFTYSSNSSIGGAYFVTINPSTLSFEAVALNGKPLTATTRAVWNKRPNDSLIAYLQTNQVVFQRISSPASNSKAISISSPIDATFTTDGYAWVLQPGGVSRFDVTNLTTINNSSFVSLNLNAQAIGTFIQQQK
jgi:hypothetical protein